MATFDMDGYQSVVAVGFLVLFSPVYEGQGRELAKFPNHLRLSDCFQQACKNIDDTNNELSVKLSLTSASRPDCWIHCPGALKKNKIPLTLLVEALGHIDELKGVHAKHR